MVSKVAVTVKSSFELLSFFRMALLMYLKSMLNFIVLKDGQECPY